MPRTHLESLLVLLSLRLVYLLHGLDVLLEVRDGMLPGLQALGEEAGGLFKSASARHVEPCPVAARLQNDLDGGASGEHTLVGSTSGTASSLMLVVAREGICVEVGEAIIVSCRVSSSLAKCVLFLDREKSERAGFRTRGSSCAGRVR